MWLCPPRFLGHFVYPQPECVDLFSLPKGHPNSLEFRVNGAIEHLRRIIICQLYRLQFVRSTNTRINMDEWHVQGSK